MDKLASIFAWIVANYQVLITALVAILTALVAIFMLVPGAEPEKTLQKVVDFIGKFSAKKKD